LLQCLALVRQEFDRLRYVLHIIIFGLAGLGFQKVKTLSHVYPAAPDIGGLIQKLLGVFSLAVQNRVVGGDIATARVVGLVETSGFVLLGVACLPLSLVSCFLRFVQSSASIAVLRRFRLPFESTCLLLMEHWFFEVVLRMVV
jgi:hypothetical protein